MFSVSNECFVNCNLATDTPLTHETIWKTTISTEQTWMEPSLDCFINFRSIVLERSEFVRHFVGLAIEYLAIESIFEYFGNLLL